MSASKAQNTTLSGTNQKVHTETTECEVALYLLDKAIAKMDRKGDTNTNLIVIARPGTGETSRRIISSRLQQLKNFLTHVRGVKNLVLGEGERIRGLGITEVYVEGKLESVIYMKKNARKLCPVPYP
jgi:hypothetical protein